MVSARPVSATSTHAAQSDDARVPANQSLLQVAERELLAALAEQRRRAFGLYGPSSPAEAAAVDRAVREICREAHRLNLRAEELVIAVKKAWTHLAPERASQLGDRDGEVLREVVSSSIEYFFEPRDAGERPAQQ